MKVGAAVPISVGELGSHLTQCGLGRAYLRTKWHFDPSNHMATIHQRYRQDRWDRQRSNSIYGKPFYKWLPVKTALQSAGSDQRLMS